MPTIRVRVSSGIDGGSRSLRGTSKEFDNKTVLAPFGKQYRWNGEVWVHDTVLRFATVNVPRNVTITNAKLRLYSGATLTSPTVNLKIQAEAVANPLPITDPIKGWDDYENRPKTMAVLWHNVPAWTEGEVYETPNFASVIQEVINLSDWLAGNPIQIFIQDDGSHDSAATETLSMRRTRAFEYPLAPGTGEYAAELEITYEEVAPPPTYTLTISATAGGTTDPTPRSYVYDEGTVVTVTALPDADYVFDHWQLDGVTVSTDLSYNVTMDADHTLHAVFIKLPPAKGILEVHAYVG